MPEAKTKVPAYRVEYAPTRWAKCHAPPCEGPRIRVGDLRIGYTVGHGDTVRFVWRHWRCVVPEFIRRVQTVVNATSELDGYSEINSEDRKRLDMAWESSQITEPDVQGNAIDKMTKGEKEKRKVRGRRIYKKSRATIVDSSSGDDDKPLGPMNGDGETTSGDDDEPLESPRSMYPTKKADATKEEEEGDEEEPIRERKTKDSDEQTPKPAPTFEKRVPYTLKALFSPPRRRTMKGKGRARTASRSSESSQDTSDSSSEEDSTDTDDDVESTGASQEGTWQNNSVERDARDKARAPQMKVGEEQKGKDKEPLRQMKWVIRRGQLPAAVGWAARPRRYRVPDNDDRPTDSEDKEGSSGGSEEDSEGEQPKDALLSSPTQRHPLNKSKWVIRRGQLPAAVGWAARPRRYRVPDNDDRPTDSEDKEGSSGGSEEDSEGEQPKDALLSSPTQREPISPKPSPPISTPARHQPPTRQELAMMSIPQLSQPLPILVPKSYEPPDAAADGGLAGGSKEDSEMGRKAPQPLFTFLAGPSAPSHISNALLQMHAPDEEMDVDEVPATAQANGETAGTTEHHMDHLPWPESTADISAKPRRNSDVATAKKKLLSVSQPEKVKQANAGRLQSDMILKEVVSHALAFHPGFNAEIIRRVAEVQAELDQVKANGAILLARLGLAEKYNAALMAQPAKKETNVMESVNGTKEAVAKSKPKPVKYALKASASSPRPKPKPKPLRNTLEALHSSRSALTNHRNDVLQAKRDKDEGKDVASAEDTEQTGEKRKAKRTLTYNRKKGPGNVTPEESSEEEDEDEDDDKDAGDDRAVEPNEDKGGRARLPILAMRFSRKSRPARRTWGRLSTDSGISSVQPEDGFKMRLHRAQLTSTQPQT